jgi:pyruvate/2-oxoglutarate dehydrogenase complex dihydrolipoamide dehydrogenase (E3) component
MPSEYSFFLENIHEDLRLAKLESFVLGLRDDVGKQFNSMGVKVINSEVMSVQGKSVLLRSGDSISFDHLIFANGNSYNNPQRVPLNTTKTVMVEGLWKLPPGADLVIYANNNPAALSVANSARALGLNVYVILSGANPFSKLPSWRYFARESVRKGINLIDNDTRLIRVDQNGVSYECGSKIATISYDFILIASKPEPNFIKVDGAIPSMLDIELSTSRLVNRSDISYVGDAAGFYSAAEAEEHARLIIENIARTSPMELNQLSLIPLSFHGSPSLAFAGPPWTWSVAASDWIEVDFRNLGWSKIHAEEGRLWYLLSSDGCNVDGIHICHPRSAELISTAIALMSRPLSHPIWRLSSIHPSASEIFKLIK